MALAEFILGVLDDASRAGAVGLISHSFGGYYVLLCVTNALLCVESLLLRHRDYVLLCVTMCYYVLLYVTNALPCATNAHTRPLVRAALNTPRWRREEAQHSHVAVRCAMLAPPSRGSALARVLLPTAEKGIWSGAVNVFSETVLGTKAGLELASTEPDASDRVFGPLPDYCETLVVAGDVGHANPILEGPSDGVVTVAETVLDTPHLHLTLMAPHNLIADHPAAVRAVISFLECQPVPGARHVAGKRE